MANPAAVHISVPKEQPIRTKRGRMTILTPQEMLDLLKAARKRSARDWAMILLTYRHGLRASEVCGLKLADIDLKAVPSRFGGSRAHFTPYNRYTSIAGNPCLTRPLQCELGCGSGLRTARTICSPARKEASSTGRSSFATFRRLPKALAFRSRSGIRMSLSTHWLLTWLPGTPTWH